MNVVKCSLATLLAVQLQISLQNQMALSSDFTIDYNNCSGIMTFGLEEGDFENCDRDYFPPVESAFPFGFDVKTCCEEHFFVEWGDCAITPGDKINIPLCVNPVGQSQQVMAKVQLDCPQGCKTIKDAVRIEKDNITMGQNGTPVFNYKNRNHTEFCVSYMCMGDYADGWNMHVEYCDCPDAFNLNCEAITLAADAEIPLCCGPSEYLSIKSSDETVFSCEKDADTENPSCSVSMDKVPRQLPNCSLSQNQEISIVQLPDDSQTLDLSSSYSCVGAIKETGKTRAAGFQCDQICHGVTPCFRYCCPEGQVWDNGCKNNPPVLQGCGSGSGIERPKKCGPGSGYLKALNLTSSNLNYNKWNNPCGEGERAEILYPDMECDASYRLNHTTNQLHLLHRGKLLNYWEFCLNGVHPDSHKGNVAIQACLPIESSPNRDKSYSITLLLSVTCLIITLLVYILVPALQNNYSKIMMNVAFSMLVGFLTLVAIKMPQWFIQGERKSYTTTTCKTLGFVNQFFLIATFAWITVMSFEIFQQIKGLQHSINKTKSWRIVKQGALAYGIPAAIVLLTLIADLSLENSQQRCAQLKPKIAHKPGLCLFFDRWEKFLWLYLPILIMLLLNTAMFIFVTYSVCRTEMGSESGNRRRETLDRILLYLRLFVGMGFIWYFEIINFLMDQTEGTWSWIPDMLNMLQGVWVFVTFVCKRNVAIILLRRSDKLYDNIMSSSLTIKNRRKNVDGKPRTADEDSKRMSLETGVTADTAVSRTQLDETQF